MRREFGTFELMDRMDGYDHSRESVRKGMPLTFLILMTGMFISGIVAFTIGTIPEYTSLIYDFEGGGLLGSHITLLGWVTILAPFGLIAWIGMIMENASVGKLALLYFIMYLAFGGMLSSIFITYSIASIQKVFFITAGMFGFMSAYGFITKKDLSSFGNLLMMFVVGLIIAGVVNIFMKSGMMDMIISFVGVLVFAGLTAYDTQNIKYLLIGARTKQDITKAAMHGAFSLFLDFVNMMLYLLRLLEKEK